MLFMVVCRRCCLWCCEFGSGVCSSLTVMVLMVVICSGDGGDDGAGDGRVCGGNCR